MRGRDGVVFGVLVAALLAGCSSATEGSPSSSGEGGQARATGQISDDEVKTLAPVCDALKVVVPGLGLPADVRYEPIPYEGYEGGQGDGCRVRSDTLTSELGRGFELSVTSGVHPDGAEGMAERIEVFEPLPGEPVEDTEIEVDGADVAFLGSKVTNNVILYAFKGNLDVTVDYNDDKLGYDTAAEQSRALAAAVLAANRFE